MSLYRDLCALFNSIGFVYFGYLVVGILGCKFIMFNLRVSSNEYSRFHHFSVLSYYITVSNHILFSYKNLVNILLFNCTHSWIRTFRN